MYISSKTSIDQSAQPSSTFASAAAHIQFLVFKNDGDAHSYIACLHMSSEIMICSNSVKLARSREGHDQLHCAVGLGNAQTSVSQGLKILQLQSSQQETEWSIQRMSYCLPRSLSGSGTQASPVVLLQMGAGMRLDDSCPSAAWRFC